MFEVGVVVYEVVVDVVVLVIGLLYVWVGFDGFGIGVYVGDDGDFGVV